jgi:aminoglycoside phosphotransferase family enzyme/predicted kinase
VSSARPPIVAALTDPGIYPHAVDRVELVETHISWVFLAGDRVYKVKKPVNLGFLDFTTLERRRFFCEEEVRLNRRLTHDVYMGVVELNGRDAITLGGPGPTRDVAVVMKRLPHDRMLDELVRRGAAEPELVEELGRIVARFHAAAPTGGEIDELGSLATVSANWSENFTQTAALPAEVLPDEWRRSLRAWTEAFMRREASRFAARVAAGRIRDCHGDLQAQHVCCTEPIQIFDCIEFNHRFRYGDVAAEIAFLAMDLDRLGRSDLAVRFLNAYLEASGDYDAVPLLDFYRAYRAFVRGKVLGFLIDARPEAAAKARERFALALRYTERRDPPRLLITTGVIGSGKSSVAREVAGRLGAIVVRTDAVRKRLAGLALSERREAGFGEGLYSPEMGQRTYAEAMTVATKILDAGWPVILDGAFSSAAQRKQAREAAARAGVPFAVLWCDAPDPVLAERLRRRAHDPDEVSDAGPDLLPQHRARYEPPDREADVIRLDTTAGVDRTAAKAVGQLGGGG